VSIAEDSEGAAQGPVCLAPCMPAGIGGPNIMAMAWLSDPISG